MSLHRSIPDNRIPLPLKQPLVFGNREQIKALNDMETDINLMETDINLMETEQAKIANKELKYFDVKIEYGGTQDVRILAVNEDDAKEKAKEEADYDKADMEIDFVSAREVKR